jgi:transcriptional regulator with XRE-family HTH domain
LGDELAEPPTKKGKNVQMSDDQYDEDGARSPYGKQVGERLRQIRRQKRMSLQEVESVSGQEFKASVLGAYERGERAISVPRLARLAGLYKVPVDQLLPGDDEDADVLANTRRDADSGAKIDLTRLEALNGGEAEMLSRYLRMIQVQRQDFNGRVLTIRRDDMRAIACILGVNQDAADRRLEELGLRL